MTGELNKVTSTKLTPAERRLMEAAAVATGQSVSSFVRAVLVPAVQNVLRETVASAGEGSGLKAERC